MFVWGVGVSCFRHTWVNQTCLVCKSTGECGSLTLELRSGQARSHGPGRMSSDSQPPQELADWLAKLNLSHYLDAACEWWVANGAISLSEVFENWEVFVADLGLKPLERKRVEKDVGNAQRSAVQSCHRLAHEVSDWLQELHLNQYAAPLLEWCEENGASTMEEVWSSWQDFVEELGLKPLERKRIERNVAARAGPKNLQLTTSGDKGRGMFGPPEDPHMYALLEEIGFGVTSKVYKCRRGKDTFAVKAISLKKLRHQPGFARISYRLHQEIEILLSLKHERIVKLVDVVEEYDCLYLVMELVSGGELGEWIVKKGAFSELMGRYIFAQISEGLAYIHSKGIIHRDLKPDNILVDEDASTPDKLQVKLSDFGHSRLINDGYTTRLTARIGTAMYWAPEVSDPTRASLGYDQSADLWSLGVVLYVMLIGFFPFDNGDHLGCQLQRDLENMTFQRRSSGPELSPDAKDLLQSLLVIDPQQRLPLKQCLSHRWTSGELDSRLEYMKLATDPNPTAVEVRVPLFVKPDAEELQLLRCDLQKWMYKFRRFAAIRQGEVIANLGEASQAELPENKSARRELQAIVERHCGRGMIVVNDQKMWTAIAESKNERLHCPVPQLIRKDMPQISKDMPQISKDVPQISKDVPQISKDVKDVRPETESHVEAAPDAEGARFVVSALQGVWESQRDSSELYFVQGLDVVRQQKSSGGVQKRPFSLRWSAGKRCLEWGSGKYFLQPPSSLPMMEAVWLASDGGRGFAWRRSAKGGPAKGGKSKGRSPECEDHGARRAGTTLRY